MAGESIDIETIYYEICQRDLGRRSLVAMYAERDALIEALKSGASPFHEALFQEVEQEIVHRLSGGAYEDFA